MSRFAASSFACLALGLAAPLLSARAATVTAIYAPMTSGDGGYPHTTLTELDGVLYGITEQGGTVNFGTAFKVDPATGTEAVLHSFTNSGDGFPDSALTSLDGTLWSSLPSGGQFGGGYLFSIDPKTGAESVVYSFNPNGPIRTPVGSLTAVGTLLYGVASVPNSSDGVVYSFDSTNGAVAVVATIPESSSNLLGGLLQVGQSLYGVNEHGYGSLYKVNIVTGGLQTVAKFDGADGKKPNSPLVVIGSKLYGTTQSGGTGRGNVFELDLGSGAVRSVYAFPKAVQYSTVLAANSVLYGTTAYGGAHGRGMVFTLDPATGILTSLHDFTGGTDGGAPYGGLTLSGSLLYGTTSAGDGFTDVGGVFSIPVSGGPLSVVHAFSGLGVPVGYRTDMPNTGLLTYHGSLYATFEVGGAASAGEVVRIDLGSTAATTLYSFTGGADGGYPTSSLVSHGGQMFGTASAGGPSGLGTAYRLDPVTGQITTLHGFRGKTDGATPLAALVEAGSNLYGTTSAGGASGLGTIFKLAPGNGRETVLHAFAGGTDGAMPVASMIDVAGTLYGTTVNGGTDGGTIFSLDTATGVQTTLVDVPFRFGYGLFDSLTDMGGLIYGVLTGGGPNAYGALFSFDPASNTLKDVYNFPGSPKDYVPESNLVSLGGKLYGTTQQGGTDNCGTVYSFDPATGAERTEYTFIYTPASAAIGRPARSRRHCPVWHHICRWRRSDRCGVQVRSLSGRSGTAGRWRAL